jgi:hypothetical protein
MALQEDGAGRVDGIQEPKGTSPKKIKFDAWQNDRKSLNFKARDTYRAIIFKAEASGRFRHRIEFR